MVFSSTIFLFVFLPIVLLLYFNPFFKSRQFRNNVLLIASLFFYAWGEPVFVVLMMFSIFVTWLIGLRAEQKDKISFVFGLIYHIFVLFVFKYLSFVVYEASGHKTRLEIILPIGISFFTFQMMSYLIDVWRGAKAQTNVLNVGLYTALFPQLIAGPIVRYETIEKEILERKETIQDFSDGIIRFVYGLGKKILIANYAAVIADNIFDYMPERSMPLAWIGALAYTIQIYFDFSGYSDMAIGLGQMFGFHFEENFNYPYIARSVTDFWRRWHISLSSWFRDYVYIPLGGNRVSKQRMYFNIFVVWLLTGIWHGANWTFIVWGLMYFVVLMIEKATRIPKKGYYTMFVVIFGWVIFRAASLPDAGKYIMDMFKFNSWSVPLEYLKGSWILLVGAVGSTPLYRYIKSRCPKFMEYIFVTVVFILSVMKVISSTYNPFIYFNF